MTIWGHDITGEHLKHLFPLSWEHLHYQVSIAGGSRHLSLEGNLPARSRIVNNVLLGDEQCRVVSGL